MQTIIIEKIPVYLTADEAMLFVEFQKNYQIIAHLLGYMSSIHADTLKNTHLAFDIDNEGKISHTAITKHYRS